MAELLRVLWACSGLFVCAAVTWVYWWYLPRRESDDSRRDPRTNDRSDAGGVGSGDDAEGF